MNVANLALDPSNSAFVHECISSGKFSNESQVINAALALLSERERLLAAIDAGTADLDEGRYTDYGEHEFDKFWENVCAEEQKLRESKQA